MICYGGRSSVDIGRWKVVSVGRRFCFWIFINIHTRIFSTVRVIILGSEVIIIKSIDSLSSSIPLAALLGVQRVLCEEGVQSSCLLQEVINNMRSVQISRGRGRGWEEYYLEGEEEEEELVRFHLHIFFL